MSYFAEEHRFRHHADHSQDQHCTSCCLCTPLPLHVNKKQGCCCTAGEAKDTWHDAAASVLIFIVLHGVVLITSGPEFLPCMCKIARVAPPAVTAHEVATHLGAEKRICMPCWSNPALHDSRLQSAELLPALLPEPCELQMQELDTVL